MHGIYILRSLKNKSLYFGYSNRIKERLSEHNNGKVASTKNKRPLELVYCELYKNQKDAMRREQFFKTGWGRNYVKKILHNTLKNS